jgi:MinD-like ATPase involved in chromosome partitioning or flagellar assembly
MATIVSLHSFRGGTGKSNTTANLAAQMATGGGRVAVVDTDVQSPGIHVLFGLDADVAGPMLNDYLRGQAPITEVARDMSQVLAPDAGGALWLVPASMKPTEIARIVRQGYDVELLNEGFRELLTELSLDVLMIDTHPGINEETLLSITVSDTLVLLLRPDRQDYQGTAVTVDIARRLDVPELLLLVNKVPSTLDPREVAREVAAAYGAEVVGVLPLTEDLVTNASAGLFSLSDPDHPWSMTVRTLARRLLPPS